MLGRHAEHAALQCARERKQRLHLGREAAGILGGEQVAERPTALTATFKRPRCVCSRWL
jgi:hypothetical protein